MKFDPQPEHAWLQKLVGDWTYETEMAMEPGKPTQTYKGTESVRSLGGLWIVAEGEGHMPGGEIGKTMMTLGYDPAKQSYVGTWVGSMMPMLWVYDGELDRAGRVLTLAAEGPSMDETGTTAKYHDVIEIESDDHRIFSGRILGNDGQWTTFMTAHYRRKK